MKYNIEVKIENIDVDYRYFSFRYIIWLDGKEIKNGTYSNDHSWGNDTEGFKDVLERGYALELALESFSYTKSDTKQD